MVIENPSPKQGHEQRLQQIAKKDTAEGMAFVNQLAADQKAAEDKMYEQKRALEARLKGIAEKNEASGVAYQNQLTALQKADEARMYGKKNG